MGQNRQEIVQQLKEKLADGGDSELFAEALLDIYASLGTLVRNDHDLNDAIREVRQWKDNIRTIG